MVGLSFSDCISQAVPVWKTSEMLKTLEIPSTEAMASHPLWREGESDTGHRCRFLSSQEAVWKGPTPLEWGPIPETQHRQKGAGALGEEEVEERGAMTGCCNK